MGRSVRLSDSEIQGLHARLVDAGVADALDTLLSGIERGVIARLPLDARPSVRLLRVLHELNEVGDLPNGEPALGHLVRNALVLARSSPEEPFFAGMVARLSLPPDSAAGPTGRGDRPTTIPVTGPEIRSRRGRALLGLLAVALFGVGAALMNLRSSAVASENVDTAAPSDAVTTPDPAPVQVIPDPAPEPSTTATSSRLSPPPPRDSNVPTVVSPAPPPSDPDGFDAVSAERELEKAARIAQATCVKSNGEGGRAVVHVTFGPGGQPTSASVSGAPIAGTQTGRCIEALFMRARISPYSGGPVARSRAVLIIPP